MKILILGGDCRAIYTAQKLKEIAEVEIFATAGFNTPPSDKFDCAVLGLPASKDGESIFAPQYDRKIPLKDIAKYVNKDGLVLGGMIKPAMRKICADGGMFCEDYYDSEIPVLENAVPSAEGALAAGITATKTSVLGMKVLVTGYGRISTLLSKYLLALGADVTVVCRSALQRSMAHINGCNAIPFDELYDVIGKFSLIYNTVPALVLSKKEVSAINRDAVYIELASASGIDLTEAKRCGVNVINEQGIPSRYAPVTAGNIIADAAASIISKYRYLYGKE